MWGQIPLPLKILRSHASTLMLRGIVNTVRPPPDIRSAMTIEHLIVLANLCDTDPRWLPMKCGLTLAFFGYLRISNIAPASVGLFDVSRHTKLADVVPTRDGLVFHLKWSKTRQHGLPTQKIPIPSLGKSPICPVKAWKGYLVRISKFAPAPSSPMLLSLHDPVGQAITAPTFRANFRLLLRLSLLDGFAYTPHSLRRGGATHSFQAGVPLQAIKRHGTWVSNAVNAYLLASPPFHTPVVSAFQRLLQV